MRDCKTIDSDALDLYIENISGKKIRTPKGVKELAKESIEKCSEQKVKFLRRAWKSIIRYGMPIINTDGEC